MRTPHTFKRERNPVSESTYPHGGLTTITVSEISVSAWLEADGRVSVTPVDGTDELRVQFGNYGRRMDAYLPPAVAVRLFNALGERLYGAESTPAEPPMAMEPAAPAPTDIEVTEGRTELQAALDRFNEYSLNLTGLIEDTLAGRGQADPGVLHDMVLALNLPPNLDADRYVIADALRAVAFPDTTGSAS